jgi:putative transposase
MDLDVESLTGAAYGERSGYRERPWHTTLGTLPVAIPKLRKGSYFPCSWGRAAPRTRRRSPSFRWPTCTVSTRAVDDLAKGHAARRHLEKPSRASMRGDRRACEGVPVASYRGIMALRVDRCALLKVREGGRIVFVTLMMSTRTRTDAARFGNSGGAVRSGHSSSERCETGIEMAKGTRNHPHKSRWRAKGQSE